MFVSLFKSDRIVLNIDTISHGSWPGRPSCPIYLAFCGSLQGHRPTVGDAEIARRDITRPDNVAPDSRGGDRETI